MMEQGTLTPPEEKALSDFLLVANEWRMSCGEQAVLTREDVLRFLMARKFDVERTLDLYRNHQAMRAERFPNGIDVNDVALQAELQSEKFTILKTKDDTGAAIAVFTARLHESSSRTATLQSIMFQLDCALTEWNTQRNGLVVIYDMSRMSLSKWDMTLATEMLKILKGSYPARVKKILVVSMPTWLRAVVEALRTFMTAKMLDRVFLLSADKLPQIMSPESLPVGLGGSYVHSHAEWIEECKRRHQALTVNRVKLRNGTKNGMLGRGDHHQDGRRAGLVFPVVNGSKSAAGDCEDPKLSISVHRQSDKGMGIVEFVNLIRSMGKEGILEEYNELRNASRALPDSFFTAFKSPENRAKNRYMDVPCLESSRVHLVNCDAKDDYIHANFVDGYDHKNAFISTQGPMPKTYGDFWTMIWEQETRVIVMTTRTVERGRTKCGQYWPASLEETLDCDGFVVVNNGTSQFAHHTQTDLTLTKLPNMETRRVTHLQFTDWPDYGVPHSAQSTFEFIYEMRSKQMEAVKEMNPRWSGPGSGPPIVVHCSAGIGRSGTLVVLDICMRRMDDTGLFCLHETVKKARSQRCHSIQMPEQYLFCYLAMVEYAVSKGLISLQDSGLNQMLTWLDEE